MKVNVKKDAQLEYLRKQLDQTIKNNRKEILSTRSVSSPSLQMMKLRVPMTLVERKKEQGGQGEEKELSTRPQISESKSRSLEDNLTLMTS